ncbi:FAD-dependent oxidoreductase [Desulfobacula sp.]|uniref:NAD(P)/FAD-dependent oxidoreductase n=1 Tax=Desulfobacula sp. TaxID=2593537 RepID=UPI00262DA3C1|nr:FAD-dependent oxidoreductase [Desulfobacula sp.]
MTADDSQYMIVGGCAAGMAAAHAIREHDRQGTVTVISEEPCAPYFRPLIPFVISGKNQWEQMALEGCGPYTGSNIFVRTHSRVASVNPAARSVFLQDGTCLGYQKILFATGSRPHMPPDIKGVDASGVFALRTLAHAKAMAQRVEQTRHAVMLGGGLLNLKTAFALLERHLKVTLVVYSPEVLSQLMAPEDALLIRKALENAGLTIKTGVSATGILSDSTGVTGVTLDDGSHLACQMVCIGKGVRPNVDYLENSGIALENGIVTDRYTACNLPDTFAAGDVAITHEPISGAPISTALWTNAVEMGRCAGQNMAGIKTAYTGTFGILNATQVADEPFVSMGVVHTENSDCQVFRQATKTTYRKMVFDADGTRLIGAVFVGDITNAGLYRYVIRERLPVSGFKQQIIDHTLNYGYFMR